MADTCDTCGTERPRVVILLGPTCAGKSKLAIDLAEKFGGEIISADSMQVYRYMDIGTAKPTPEERQKVRHHLIDVVAPDQDFHAGLYRVLGRRAIDQLHARRMPIWVAGGTGLYIRTLTQGLFPSPKIDSGIRERLRGEARIKGDPFLHKRLKEVDPQTASRVHPHDTLRIIRALEVFEATGLPISYYHQQHRFGDQPYLTLKIGLETDRDALYRRIDNRVDRMVEQGFVQEVEGLLNMGYGPELKPMQSLGYKQMVQFIRGEKGWDETLLDIKKKTRHFAKRQWTWFKADPEICWREEDRERIFLEVQSFLTA